MVNNSSGQTEPLSHNKMLAGVSSSLRFPADTDVLLLNGQMASPIDLMLIELCASRRRRKNVMLILVTEGGSADSAYRIARCLQNFYEQFSLFVTGYCKSAGTLVALGAHELIVADSGELGPLDVQMLREDELGSTRSGLTVLSALSALRVEAYNAFEHFFLETQRRSGGSISTRTAIHLVTNLAGELFGRLYGHIDAMHVGEAGRSLNIARKYGQILRNQSENCRSGTLAKLTTSYPSHGFVIDRMQCESLFNNVRPPDEVETEMASRMKVLVVEPARPENSILSFLSPELDDTVGLGGNAEPPLKQESSSDADG